MSLFSDNQTKHFYALKSTDKYVVNNLANSDLIRVIGYNAANWDGDEDEPIEGAEAMFTTDVINRKLIKHAKVNEIKPTYFRKWTITAPTSVTAGKTYHIYFYLENLLGFGMQDRWDVVASYTAKDNDTVSTVMTALKNDLDLKLNGAGPIKNDFTVELSGTSIIVKENPNSKTFKQLNEIDLRMHTTPYAYHVTMSTFDGTSAWGDQRQVNGVEDKNIGTYIKAATKVLDMELYFLRNRGDLYDLTKDFYVSILNDTNTDTSAEKYYTVDIDYAFSDTQGYTYHSDKQISFAVTNAEDANTLMEAIIAEAANTSTEDTVDDDEQQPKS